jgi:phage FluMu gp28-like protein
VEFTVQSKDELARGVREGLEWGEFLLQNDGKFHRQIHSIKRIPTSGGAFRYDSERDDRGHADSFWAWALANYAIPK